MKTALHIISFKCVVYKLLQRLYANTIGIHICMHIKYIQYNKSLRCEYRHIHLTFVLPLHMNFKLYICVDLFWGVIWPFSTSFTYIVYSFPEGLTCQTLSKLLMCQVPFHNILCDSHAIFIKTMQRRNNHACKVCNNLARQSTSQLVSVELASCMGKLIRGLFMTIASMSTKPVHEKL